MLFRHPSKSNSPEQFVVPRSLRDRMLAACHDTPMFGHMGICATKKKIAKRFTRPNLFQDITRLVESCDICRRHSRRLPKLNSQESNPLTRLFDKVAINILGPLPLLLTDTDLRSLSSIVDWPECTPLKDISSVEVANALFSVFTRLGLPKEILLGNAQQLVSKAMAKVMSLLP
ncbi:Gypsy retrotransposon integrase-like protein 1 [Elysia marginata]|uniref:Gypsy retrotransposon integrase-like protein 1 n=1 Tax=Elysia marginata TaxID=1093978 RepID=A0AAV4GDX4_9GAST|nr:Gypsy retrotransposon integrase-like protein 1 [Elysia marginata]